MVTPDQRLRELKAAADQDPEQLAAYRRELERVGLCPDCEGDKHPEYVSEACPDHYLSEFPRPPHANGVRCRDCQHCRGYIQAITNAPFRAAATSRVVVRLALAHDPCPGRARATLRAANPYPPRPSHGDGYANARTTWQRYRKAAVEAMDLRLAKSAGPLFGAL